MRGLFDEQETQNERRAEPLAARMRPRTLEEFVGQQHFLGPGQLLRRIIDADRIGSLIFYGPPGTGKTSLAEIIAGQTEAHFARLNAAATGVKELRSELEQARDRLRTSGHKTVLFVDELHHFNRTQQDVLLPDVEQGVVSLIGATTANPFFSLASALISRSRVFEFRPLSEEDVLAVLRRSMSDSQRGLAGTGVSCTDEALQFLATVCDGDVRQALSALEIGVLSVEEGQPFDLTVAQQAVQKRAVRYDATGDEHYDAASALIKSMRGSDPDAAVYWLARMLEGGEDPRFIARRIVICASEDIGNADPQALPLAMAAAQATEMVGLPECRIALAQAVTYLATAPKSNAAYKAIGAAQQDVRERRIVPVPRHLRSAAYPGAKRLERGEGYDYPHNHPDGWVEQEYLGIPAEYYQPTDRGYEQAIRERMERLRQRRDEP